MLKKIIDTDSHNVVMASIGSGATKTGASGAVLGWLFSQEVLAVLGVVIAVIGLVVNWYYNHKRNQRENAEHVLRMKELRDEYGGNDVK